MNSNYIVMLALAGCLCAGCQSKSAKAETNPSQTETVSTEEQDIPYKIAEGYFQNNQVKQLPSAPITTNKDFDSLFGMATVMGENGAPTAIDFTKEYVIAVGKPKTDIATTLIPLSLKRNADGEIVFKYHTITGAKQSYSILPCLIIIVPNEYKGRVVLQEAE
ncbi:MAG: hypothetical protein Q4D56_13150 [Bacteroides sp.]|nr:hypothetical protein [Bacteroides sp.]